MSQTKLGSFVESWANIAVGFTINYIANLLIFPLFGFHISLEANFLMGAIYTVISLVRSFLLRLYFNGLKFGNTLPDTYEDGYATSATALNALLDDRYAAAQWAEANNIPVESLGREHA